MIHAKHNLSRLVAPSSTLQVHRPVDVQPYSSKLRCATHPPENAIALCLTPPALATKVRSDTMMDELVGLFGGW